jgi:hypothetical protein
MLLKMESRVACCILNYLLFDTCQRKCQSRRTVDVDDANFEFQTRVAVDPSHVVITRTHCSHCILIVIRSLGSAYKKQVRSRHHV